MLRILLFLFTIYYASAQLVLSPIDSCPELKTSLTWIEELREYLAVQLSPLFPIVLDYRKQLHQQYVQWCIERY